MSRPSLLLGLRRCPGIWWFLPIPKCPCLPVVFAIPDFGLQRLLFTPCGSVGAEEWPGLRYSSVGGCLFGVCKAPGSPPITAKPSPSPSKWNHTNALRSGCRFGCARSVPSREPGSQEGGRSLHCCLSGCYVASQLCLCLGVVAGCSVRMWYQPLDPSQCLRLLDQSPFLCAPQGPG